MTRSTVTVKGGDKLARVLADLGRRMGKGTVSIGFLAGATYPAKKTKPTLPVATVAFWNEYGTSRAPARPFMRDTISEKSPEWGARMARIAQATKFNGPQTLKLMGEGIRDQFVTAITRWPADNAASTEQRKGFNKGLIDTGVMQRSVDYEVKSV